MNFSNKIWIFGFLIFVISFSSFAYDGDFSCNGDNLLSLEGDSFDYSSPLGIRVYNDETLNYELLDVESVVDDLHSFSLLGKSCSELSDYNKVFVKNGLTIDELRDYHSATLVKPGTFKSLFPSLSYQLTLGKFRFYQTNLDIDATLRNPTSHSLGLRFSPPVILNEGIEIFKQQDFLYDYYLKIVQYDSDIDYSYNYWTDGSLQNIFVIGFDNITSYVPVEVNELQFNDVSMKQNGGSLEVVFE